MADGTRDIRGAKRILEELEGELIAFRRDVHAHPELSYQERRTSRVIADRLRAAGLEPRAVTETGLVCDVGAGPVSAVLRADIDALPVGEETGLPWASTVPEVAHACGHDVHLTALLGAGIAALVASRRRKA